MVRAAKRFITAYVNSWFTTLPCALGLLLTAVLAGHYWLGSCMTLSWTPLMQSIDKIVTVLFLPFFYLGLIASFGFVLRLARKQKLKDSAVFIVISLLVLLSGSQVFLSLVNASPLCTGTPRSEAYALEDAQRWTGLWPLPDSANITTVGMKPGLYPQVTFVVFQANSEEVDTWINSSPVVRNVAPTSSVVDNREVLEYSISSKIKEDFATVKLFSGDKREVYIVTTDPEDPETIPY